jgi:hypothetical protein
MRATVSAAALPLMLLGLGATGVARAQDPPPADVAPVDLRAFVGLGSGVAAQAWVPGGRVRFDADLEALWPGEVSWGGLAAVVPLVGTAREFVGVRLGYQLEYMTKEGPGWQGSRIANTPDVGLVARVESARGSAVEVQLGGEAVFREARAICCDDAALRTRTFGVRVALEGELALSPAWALVGQAGVRTGDHVLEIRILPTASAGVRYRF